MQNKKNKIRAQKSSSPIDVVQSTLKKPGGFSEHFMSNFHDLIHTAQKDKDDPLDRDTIKQVKLLFHILQSKLHNFTYKNILKNLSMIKVKSAYDNKRVSDVSLFYAKQLYQTSNITNPEGFRDLISHIEKEQGHIAVKGKLFEVIYAVEYAKKGCKVQFGGVDGKGGDVVVFGANEYGYEDKTVQMKYLTGLSEKKFKDHCRVAAEQLGTTRKGRKKLNELPVTGNLREVVIVVEHPDHPVTRESKTKLGIRLQSIFENTPKSNNVDIFTIKTTKNVFQYQLKDIL
jgi:hypothetical protein